MATCEFQHGKQAPIASSIQRRDYDRVQQESRQLSSVCSSAISPPMVGRRRLFDIVVLCGSKGVYSFASPKSELLPRMADALFARPVVDERASVSGGPLVRGALVAIDGAGIGTRGSPRQSGVTESKSLIFVRMVGRRVGLLARPGSKSLSDVALRHLASARSRGVGCRAFLKCARPCRWQNEHFVLTKMAGPSDLAPVGMTEDF